MFVVSNSMQVECNTFPDCMTVINMVKETPKLNCLEILLSTKEIEEGILFFEGSQERAYSKTALEQENALKLLATMIQKWVYKAGIMLLSYDDEEGDVSYRLVDGQWVECAY